jgi:hypothetical protein
MTVDAEFAAKAGQFEEATRQLRVSAGDLSLVPSELIEAAAAAGFQATVGTIAFAGQYASGSYNVQYNNSDGGFSSEWPQWAFELAKDALLGGKRVWVASNGDPFGFNLVFVLIFP